MTKKMERVGDEDEYTGSSKMTLIGRDTTSSSGDYSNSVANASQVNFAAPAPKRTLVEVLEESHAERRKDSMHYSSKIGQIKVQLENEKLESTKSKKQVRRLSLILAAATGKLMWDWAEVRQKLAKVELSRHRLDSMRRTHNLEFKNAEARASEEAKEKCVKTQNSPTVVAAVESDESIEKDDNDTVVEASMICCKGVASTCPPRFSTSSASSKPLASASRSLQKDTEEQSSSFFSKSSSKSRGKALPPVTTAPLASRMPRPSATYWRGFPTPFAPMPLPFAPMRSPVYGPPFAPPFAHPLLGFVPTAMHCSMPPFMVPPPLENIPTRVKSEKVSKKAVTTPTSSTGSSGAKAMVSTPARRSRQPPPTNPTATKRRLRSSGATPINTTATKRRLTLKGSKTLGGSKTLASKTLASKTLASKTLASKPLASKTLASKPFTTPFTSKTRSTNPLAKQRIGNGTMLTPLKLTAAASRTSAKSPRLSFRRKYWKPTNSRSKSSTSSSASSSSTSSSRGDRRIQSIANTLASASASSTSSTTTAPSATTSLRSVSTTTVTRNTAANPLSSTVSRGSRKRNATQMKEAGLGFEEDSASKKQKKN